MKRFVKEVKDSILTRKFNRYVRNKMKTCLKLSKDYYTRYLHDAYVYGLNINPNYGVISSYYWKKYKAWSNIRISLAEKFLSKDWWWMI